MPAYQLYSTGSNSHGQLGIGTDEDVSVFTRVRLPVACEPIQLAFGANHSLLLALVNGKRTLFGAGSNRVGQLGPRDAAPRFEFDEMSWNQLGLEHAGVNGDDFDIVAIASTWETSFVHLRPRPTNPQDEPRESDVLVSFGANDWGERGVPGGASRNPAGVTVVPTRHVLDGPSRIARIVAGPRHVLALLESIESSSTERVLVGWGASRHGQLGSLNQTGKLPRIVAQPEVVQLPTPFSPLDIVDFSCGKDHSAILLLPMRASTSTAKPTIVTLGSNKHGQLGPMLSVSSSQSPSPNCNILPISTICPDLWPLDPTSSIGVVCTTWNSTFVPLPPRPHNADPSVVSFGSNSHGQLGTPHDVPPLDPSANVSSLLDLVRVTRVSQRDRHATEASPHTQTSSPPPSCPQSPSLHLHTGSEHVLAIVESLTSSDDDCSRPRGGPPQQELWAWGWNEHGNLGLGDVQDRIRPTRVPLLPDVLVVVDSDGVVDDVRDRVEVGRGPRIVGCWAGMATSWISIEID